MSVSGAKTAWIEHLDVSSVQIDGLVRVAGYLPDGRPPEEVVTMEKAASYGAYAVFFEAGKQGRPGHRKRSYSSMMGLLIIRRLRSCTNESGVGAAFHSFIGGYQAWCSSSDAPTRPISFRLREI